MQQKGIFTTFAKSISVKIEYAEFNLQMQQNSD